MAVLAWSPAALALDGPPPVEQPAVIPAQSSAPAADAGALPATPSPTAAPSLGPQPLEPDEVAVSGEIAETPRAVALHAAAKAHAGPAAGWRAWAADRLAAERQSAAPVLGALPGDHGVAPSTASWNRLRAGLGWTYRAAQGFVREVQTLAEVDANRGGLDRFDASGTWLTLRKAWVEVTTVAGQFGVGRTTSQWGLGLVAQGGEEDPLQFGMRRGGSLVDRMQFAVVPAAAFQAGDPLEAFPLAVVLAYDRVVADDLMRLRDPWDGVRGGADTGRNLIAALLYRGKSLQLGAYASARNQTDAEGLGLTARIFDAFGRWQARLQGWQVTLSGEGVYAAGTTTWLRTPAQPDHLLVEQFGGAARVEVERKSVHMRLEAGIASGDSRPFDDTVRNFAFASDYRVGLVLFPAYMGAVSAVAARNLADPRFVGQGPAGVEHVLTHGATTQAMYLNPVVRLRVGRHLAVMGGMVWARAPVDVADPFQTFLAGGTPTGPRGARAGRDLGLEVDGAVEYLEPLGSAVDLLVRGDAGVLLPGDAFDDAAGNAAPAMAVVQGQVALRAKW